MKKILYIAPHLSTGGMPQYLLEIIRTVSGHDQYVVEYDCISKQYTIQRDEIIRILDFNTKSGDQKFYSLTKKYRQQLSDLIVNQEFDIIHFMEIPELFMEDWMAEYIYKKDRPYAIIETSHTVNYDPIRKKYYPDEFVLVSDYQKKQYQPYFSIPIHVVEYPEYRQMINRTKEDILQELGLLTFKKHILIVGLFTPDKNQGYAMEIAKHLPDYQFHFIGNTAENFKDYWEPLLKDKPQNCFIWGERTDLDLWYAGCNLLLFPSYNPNRPAECNPIVLKEAVGWDMTIFRFPMESLEHKPNTHYLTGNAQLDASNMDIVLL